MAALLKVPAFQALSEAEARALAQVCTKRTIPPSTVIWQQDGNIDDLIIIQTGYIKLVQELASRKQRYHNAEFLSDATIKPHWGAASTDPRWAHVKSPVKEALAATRVKKQRQERKFDAPKAEVAISARTKARP